jgi:molybdopterin-binding protein
VANSPGGCDALGAPVTCSPDPRAEPNPMKISARNTLPGIVRKVEQGAVNAEVSIELAPSLSIVSIITLDAARSLKVKPGDRAYAVIKASSVMVGID